MINGVPADYLNVNDRSIHYGDGLFETLLFDDKKLFYWQQHYQRLFQSASHLKLHCPDEQVLLNDIKQLLTAADSQSGVIKIIVTRGEGERGYQFSPTSHNENRIVFISALASEHSSILSGQLLSGDLYLCQQQVSINENLAGLKHLNRLDNVLARNEWLNTNKNSYLDGLMLNANQQVIEGTMSNLFAIKDKQLLTPDLRLSGVNGIIRAMIIKRAKINNIRVNITDISINELALMDEVFISNSLIGIKTINKIGQTLYKKQDNTQLIFNDLLNTMNDYAKTL